MCPAPDEIECTPVTQPGSVVHNSRLEEIHRVAYHEWKLHGHHLEEYACEFLGTGLLVFAVVGAVAVVQAAGSPVTAAIQSLPLKLLLTGFLIASSGMLVTVSPLGRLSGAHLNPVISLGFWQLGKLQFRDLIGYVVSQMAGGLVGAEIARRAFGSLAQRVKYAAMSPSPHAGVLGAFAGEVLCTFVMALAIFFFVSHKRLASWTPFMLVALIPFLVLGDATISGCGMNPARWYGPAYIANVWIAAWIYVIGPIVGTVIAVIIRKSDLSKNAIPVTAKLFHDPRYRSIFLHDQCPTTSHDGMSHP
jgi:aquaporin Z